jgi:ABC-type uncharacterized transport system ATPase subunit
LTGVVNATARLELDGITKRFPNVVANDAISLDVQPGEIHAVLGENGAGKSTLMEIVFGFYRPDDGSIRLDGAPQEIESPRHAMDLGIGMVHQHFTLVPTLTVAENIALEERSRKPWVRLEPILERLDDLSTRYGLGVPPLEAVGHLSVGELQRVELLKALFREVRLLILDEPTALLTPLETAQLFRVMRDLAAEDRSIVFISHKLREVLEIADTISVLRNGKLQKTLPTSEADEHMLARLMVGDAKSLRQVDRGPRPSIPADTSVKVANLVVSDRRRAVLRGLNLEIESGEILGIAGVEGNGQRELIEALVGLRRADAGAIELCGRDVTGLRPEQIAQLGIGFIPSDRQSEGLVMGLTVAENIMLRSHLRGPHTRWGFLWKRAISRKAAELARLFGVTGSAMDDRIGQLSGGNQQKVVLARELNGEPRVIVAAQPTRGLDIAAEKFVHDQLRDHRARGAAILLVSTNLDEILDLSDMVAVLFEGELVGEVPAERADRNTIGLLMAGRVPPEQPGARSSGQRDS